MIDEVRYDGDTSGVEPNKEKGSGRRCVERSSNESF